MKTAKYVVVGVVFVSTIVGMLTILGLLLGGLQKDVETSNNFLGAQKAALEKLVELASAKSPAISPSPRFAVTPQMIDIIWEPLTDRILTGFVRGEEESMAYVYAVAEGVLSEAYRQNVGIDERVVLLHFWRWASSSEPVISIMAELYLRNLGQQKVSSSSMLELAKFVYVFVNNDLGDCSEHPNPAIRFLSRRKSNLHQSPASHDYAMAAMCNIILKKSGFDMDSPSAESSFAKDSRGSRPLPTIEDFPWLRSLIVSDAPGEEIDDPTPTPDTSSEPTPSTGNKVKPPSWL